MYAGIDLGSTNIKCAVYDENMKLLSRLDHPVTYFRENGVVEFDAYLYAKDVVALLKETMEDAKITSLKGMSFTGQAETLVVVGEDGLPLRNAISWMDDRSTKECEELSAKFSPKTCEKVTGQMAVLPTWPATKILWLKHNEPETYQKAATYFLLKDYIIYYLTGEKYGDMSIATFSFYFNIYEKTYWKEMLKEIGISEENLPTLKEPCTRAGELLPEHKETLGIKDSCFVNIGTLDHFAGMIGTGNLEVGNITLSTGTVMAMATFSKAVKKNCGAAMHYGFMPDTYIMLPVAESGGVSLEWFKRTCMPNASFREIDDELLKRGGNDLLFLPYLVGTNAPEFDSNVSGVFYGLRQEHDSFDMAYAVMEGVAFVLRKNLEAMKKIGTVPTSIIATGGGAKSPLWCKLQADITGLPVKIPAEKEAACLGASMIAAVDGGTFKCLHCAAKACVSFKEEYKPEPNAKIEAKYRKFNELYKASLKIAEMK